MVVNPLLIANFAKLSLRKTKTDRLSKRGNRHLRRAVYLMTASVVSKNAWFKAYFQKRKAEGLPPQKEAPNI